MTKPDLILAESEKAFLHENARADALTDRADKFIGAIAILAGFQLTQTKGLAFTGSPPERIAAWLFLSGFALLGVGLVLAALSMTVRMYYAYPRGNKLMDELKSVEIDEETAKIKLARMYLNAQDKNALVNDNRGRLLAWSGACIVLGLLAYLVSYLWIWVLVP